MTTIRQVRAAICLLLACWAPLTIAAIVESVEGIAVTVADAERSTAFYRDVLGFTVQGQREVDGAAYEHLYGVFGARIRIVTLRLGDETLRVEQFLAPPGGRPIPVDSASNDRWFQHIAIIVSDMDRAYAWLRDHEVRHASTAPQLLPAWNPNAGGIAAFYFRDPDGHNLEILHFPADKGDAKWQRPTQAMFLGIDHTAIAVADTDASLAFYSGTLGMRVAGTSENFGIEQERLNNVFGARLRITALRAAIGPGVELLEYLAPRTGRPMPLDTRANDLWSWHIDMRGDVAAADAAVRAHHHAYVSPGPVAFDTSPQQRLLVRDPDGHAVLLEGAVNTGQ
jgi:catechol 2,3-dioxygenase-like lactoylglutathione lyase family enzyme